MSQSDTFNVLKKNGNWMSSKEISKLLNQSSGSISVNLKKLFVAEFVRPQM